jgi:uncharacterized protein
MTRRLLPLLLMLLAGAAPGAGPAARAGAEARVTDPHRHAHRRQQAELEQKLAAFEQRKGAQVALLIVPPHSPKPSSSTPSAW